MRSSQALLSTVKALPPVRKLREARYERFFARAENANLFRGVFSSFAEARQSAPPTKPLGYDHPGPAAMYRERMQRLHPSDYPVLFWLSRRWEEVSSVFDLGGHVGVSYYAYRRHLPFRLSHRWRVMDVPAVAQEGETLAREEDAPALSFTTSFADADGADVLLANGSLQYLEAPLASLLAGLAKPPRHLLLNMVPLTRGPGFVTLQNIGSAYCPYKVLGLDALLAELASAGYRQVDVWENAEKRCHIPFHEGRSLDHYTGLYLVRDA